MQAVALEKMLYVTSTLEPVADPPPRPKLKDLAPVNCNPRNPATTVTQVRIALRRPENG